MLLRSEAFVAGARDTTQVPEPTIPYADRFANNAQTKQHALTEQAALSGQPLKINEPGSSVLL